MTKTLIGVVMFLSFASSTHSAMKKERVMDEKTAVAIAEKKLMSVYGKKKTLEEEPFHATLKDGVWTVFGTLTCPDVKGGRTTICAGGVAEIKISKEDGRILYVTHGK